MIDQNLQNLYFGAILNKASTDKLIIQADFIQGYTRIQE